MTKEEIIKLAREAGFDPHDMSDDFTCNLEDIERFADLVAEHERKVWVEKRHAAWHEGFEAGRNAERNFCAAVAEWTPDAMGTAQKIAAAIRART